MVVVQLFWSMDLVWFTFIVRFLQKRNEKKEASEKKYYEGKALSMGSKLQLDIVRWMKIVD